MKDEQINEEIKNKNNKAKKNNKPKKHKVLRGILRFLLIILILLVLFVGGFVGYSALKNGWGWKGLVKTAVGSSEVPVEELEEYRVLILGVSKDISVELTDTIMVASYNPKTQSAVLLSIPRDTFVGDSKLSASSYDKINAIYQSKGAEGTLKEVNELTGLNIDKYIVIDNNALVELVDEIGGVEFNVPINMNYDSKAQDLHIHLKAGLQKLNGDQAEQLVRFRKNNDYTGYSAEYGSDDYGRMRTQRDFIKALAEQTLQAKNITKIGNLVDIVQKNVKTNITDWDEVKKYIPYVLDFNMDNLKTDSIPGESTRIPANTGIWFFLADEIKTKELINELFSTDETTTEGTDEQNATNNTTTNSTTSSTTTNSKIKIELLNGSGNSELLDDAQSALEAEGYNVTNKGKASTQIALTRIINRSNLSDSVMSSIKTLLGTGTITPSSITSKYDMTIILGKDYVGKN